MAISEEQFNILVSFQDEASSKMASMQKQLDSLSNSAKSSAPSFLSMASAVALGQAALQALETVGRDVVGMFKDGISIAEKNQNAMALINNEIKNLGDLAPITAAGAEQLAEKLSETTVNSKETVLSAEQILLKFNVMGKDTFPMAMQAASDLSATLGTDMPSAANLIGKALENPTRATIALTQAGVKFTKAQKDVLKEAAATGNVAQADDMILRALSQNLQGQSVAAASTFSGKMQILGHDFDDFKEKIGDAIIKGVAPFVDKLENWATSDKAQATMQRISDDVQKFTQFLTDNWKTIAIVVGILGTLAGVIAAVELGVRAYTAIQNIAKVATSLWTAAQWLLNIALDANPIGIVILAIGALIAIVILTIKYWKDIVAALKDAWQWVENLVTKHQLLFAILAPGLLIIVELVKHWTEVKEIAGEVWDALKSFGNWLAGVFHPVLSGISTVVSDIGNAIGKVVGAAKTVGSDISKGLSAIGLASGGIVYAQSGMFASGSDTIPAMLTPGEMVLNSSQQAALFGQLNGKGGGQNISVNIYGNISTANGQQDIEDLAKRLGTIIQNAAVGI